MDHHHQDSAPPEEPVVPTPDELVPKSYQRHVIWVVVTLIGLVGLIGTTASWKSFALILQVLTLPTMAIGFAFYLVWWGLDNHQAGDSGPLYRAAKDGNMAAAVALFRKPLLFIAVLAVLMFGAKSVWAAGSVPPQAHAQLPSLVQATNAYWPGGSAPYLAALIHHESGCPGLRSCWSPRAQLGGRRADGSCRAARKDGGCEEGAGLGQITRAWRADGSLRFDALADLKSRHQTALADLNWGNIYDRPELQQRAVALMVAGIERTLSDVPDWEDRLDMVDACYSGGCGGLRKERAACRAAGCDPNVWRGHVELFCLKSRAPLYGRRSACDINREHVVIVRIKTQPLYAALMGGK